MADFIYSILPSTRDLMERYPTLGGMCCAPRSKNPVGSMFLSSTEGNGNASAETDGGLVEEQPKLESESEDGSDSGKGERAVSTALPPFAELRVLEALLNSEECSSEGRQELLAYATQPHGRRACIDMLRAQASSPRSLWPDALAIVQELLSQLMLDTMQREESEDVKTLVDVSHAISLVSCTECAECECEE
tara:strand:+ start:1039 stop:1614 length:576 start_codon:yes stop_codon:yes gene_type:complete